MAITEQTGFPVGNDGTPLSTLSVTPVAVGDLLLLWVLIGTVSVHVTGVTGGGANGTGWQSAEAAAPTLGDLEIWWATVGTTGSSTITVSYSGSVSGDFCALICDSWTAGAGTTWSVVTGGAIYNSSASTSVTFPNLTSGASAGAGQLWWGVADSTSAQTGSVTPTGFTVNGSLGGYPIVYDPTISTSTAYQPVAHQASSGRSAAVGVIVKATAAAASLPGITLVNQAVKRASYY